MVEVKAYHLPPTKLIPNSPHPLLHYPGYLVAASSSTSTSTSPSQTELNPPLSATEVHNLFYSNKWQTQWVFCYGISQRSHYHSQVHECMAVLSGQAKIRFGVADTSSDLELSTHGTGKEEGGIELEAGEGDVFILPAGVAHKTFNAQPVAELKLLTPEDGHHITPSLRAREEKNTTAEEEEEKQQEQQKEQSVRSALAEIKLDGFTMIGAYPFDSHDWNFATGGEDQDRYEQVWDVPKPEFDPVLGSSTDGLCGLWK